MRTNLFWLVAITLAGCSPDAAPPIDLGLADRPPDMILPKRAPNDHPPMIQMDYFGGPLLTNIEVVTIVWQGDEAIGQHFQDYTDWLVKSDEFWIASLKEYGIGKGTAAGYFVLPEAKPSTIDDSQLTKKLTTYIGNLLPAATSNKTLYQFIIPKGTNQTMFGGQGCTVYAGYHSEVKVSGVYVPYSINLQCPGSDMAEVEATVSHEAVEAATDPHPGTKPGYRASGAPLGGENGDLCNPLANTYKVDRVVDGGSVETFAYTASRNWSNANALAGDKDPCLPTPAAHPYYNTAISPPDPAFDSTNNPKGVDYMVQIQPFAFGEVGKIKWVLDINPPTGVTFTPTSGDNMAGDTVWMTVHVDPSAQSGGYAFILASQAGVGGINYWQSTLTIN